MSNFQIVQLYTFLKLTKEAIEDGKKMKDTIHNKVKDMVLQVTVAAFIIVNPILLRHLRPGYC